MSEEKHFEEYQDQTRVKHAILRPYLRTWATIMQRTSKKLVYCDGFAGGGTYGEAVEEEGSPFIALKLAGEMKGRFDARLWCCFVENDETRAARLVEALKNKGYASPEQFVVSCDTFESVVDRILSTTRNLAPTFFFVDPCGWKGYPMALLRRILARKGTELLINFMYNAVNRHIQRKELWMPELFGFSEAAYDKFLESLDQDRENKIRDTYVSQLKNFGRAKYVYPFKVRFPGVDRTYFYLIHACNHIKGLKVMKDVMFAEGGNSLHYAALGKSESQLSLFSDEPEPNELEAFLLERYVGTSRSFDRIIEETYDDTPFREPDYRTVLKSLRSRGIVTSKNITSKGDRGLSGDDIVIFPDSLTSPRQLS